MRPEPATSLSITANPSAIRGQIPIRLIKSRVSRNAGKWLYTRHAVLAHSRFLLSSWIGVWQASYAGPWLTFSHPKRHWRSHSLAQ